MANRRRTSISQPPPPPPLTRAEIERGIRRLSEALESVRSFNLDEWDGNNDPVGIIGLRSLIEGAVEKTFPVGSASRDRYGRAHHIYGSTAIYFGGGRDYDEERRAYRSDIEKAKELLAAAIDELNRDLAEIEDPTEEQAVSASEVQTFSSEVFIVHGHDNEPKEAVARFLEALRLVPIILHDRPNQGRTIIQKFREEAANVGFAVVLLTPDDELPDGTLRARQNVILELGFFLGNLGPARVAAIVKGNVDTPSDFDGVVYIPFNDGWKVALLRELDAAGYDVDWNVLRGRSSGT